MKVILLSNIEKLGNKGDVVNVKRGYARNYLIPREMAIYATPHNLKKIGDIRQKAAQEEEIRLAELRKIADAIGALNLVFYRKTDEKDTMFGSVSEADIAGSLSEHGINIQKSAVQLEKHIKELGQSQIQIRLHKDVSATLNIDVRKEEQETDAIETPQPEIDAAVPAVTAPLEMAEEPIQPVQETIEETEAAAPPAEEISEPAEEAVNEPEPETEE